MRISAKGRYALASAVHMSEHHAGGQRMTVIDISKRLGISKIYLEQVFSLLKKGNVLISSKGAQGGYSLARPPREITMLDILSPIEASLFESAETAVDEKSPDIEQALQSEVYEPLDAAIRRTLEGITLEHLATAAQKNRAGDGMMFYI